MYEGSTYFVVLSIILPPIFPNTAPIISFVNPDGTAYTNNQQPKLLNNKQ